MINKEILKEGRDILLREETKSSSQRSFKEW